MTIEQFEKYIKCFNYDARHIVMATLKTSEQPVVGLSYECDWYDDGIVKVTLFKETVAVFCINDIERLYLKGFDGGNAKPDSLAIEELFASIPGPHRRYELECSIMQHLRIDRDRAKGVIEEAIERNKITKDEYGRYIVEPNQ